MVDELESAASVKQEQSRDSGVPVKLSDSFRKYWSSDASFLTKPLGLREAAGIRSFPLFEADGVHHSVAVEEMVSGGRREERVRTVTDVDAVKERRNAAVNG